MLMDLFMKQRRWPNAAGCISMHLYGEVHARIHAWRQEAARRGLKPMIRSVRWLIR